MHCSKQGFYAFMGGVFVLFLAVGLFPGEEAQAGGILANLAPVAVDDSGAGFITDKDTAVVLPDVLANDSDANGDPLFIESFSTAETLGSVTLFPAGQLDTRFGTNGKWVLDISGYEDRFTDLQIGPDGKIYAVGITWRYDPVKDLVSDVILMRFLPNGTPDTTFGSAGKVVTDIRLKEGGHAILLQPDGKILVAGQTLDSGVPGEILLMRYLPDASLDQDFGTGGIVTTDFGGKSEVATSLQLQPDGKILVGGTQAINYSHDQFLLARYLPDGGLDTSFGTQGVVLTTEAMEPYADIVLQEDGILLAGSCNGTTIDFCVARFDLTGTLDSTFGVNGWAQADIGGSADYLAGLVQQPDGKIVLGGSSGPLMAVVRFDSLGDLDADFGNAGLATTTLAVNAYPTDLLLQPDGKLLLSGWAWQGAVVPDVAMARYNPDGSPDMGFGDHGIVVDDLGETEIIAAAALDGDGNILIAGLTSINDSSWSDNLLLARFTPRQTFHYDPNGQFNGLTLGQAVTDEFIYSASDGELTGTATVTITIWDPYRMFLPAITR